MSGTAPKKRYAPRLPPAERREQLLDTALALIGEHGYGGVSMEAVARAAGIAKPVVYDLFSNRGELLQQLLEREERRSLDQLAAAMPRMEDGRDPDALLLEGFRALLDAIAAEPTTWRLILLPAEGTPAVVRAHVERGRRLVAEQLERVLAWGLEQRGGPAGLDVEIAVQLVIGAGEQAGRLVLTDPERYSPERLVEFSATALAALR